jgi:hypothetical protein
MRMETPWSALLALTFVSLATLGACSGAVRVLSNDAGDAVSRPDARDVDGDVAPAEPMSFDAGASDVTDASVSTEGADPDGDRGCPDAGEPVEGSIVPPPRPCDAGTGPPR